MFRDFKPDKIIPEIYTPLSLSLSRRVSVGLSASLPPPPPPLLLSLSLRVCVYSIRQEEYLSPYSGRSNTLSVSMRLFMWTPSYKHFHIAAAKSVFPRLRIFSPFQIMALVFNGPEPKSLLCSFVKGSMNADKIRATRSSEGNSARGSNSPAERRLVPSLGSMWQGQRTKRLPS